MELLQGQEPSLFNRVNFLWAGLAATVIGLYVFNVGLTKGLSTLGKRSNTTD